MTKISRAKFHHNDLQNIKLIQTIKWLNKRHKKT